MKKVYLIHGWEGTPDHCWYPWLKKELEAKGFSVIIPEMLESDNPQYAEWLAHLQEIVKEPDENTYFVGHSLGCITILRYLENLADDVKIGGAVLVAGFPEPIGYDEINSFFPQPLDYKKIKQHTNKFIAIHSDDDPYVHLENGELLEEKLGAQLIIKEGQKHFAEGTTELPAVLESVLSFI